MKPTSGHADVAGFGEVALEAVKKFLEDNKCKVLALHGLLTHHVSRARAQYRCHQAVHTASTLEVQYRHIQSWSLARFRDEHYRLIRRQAESSKNQRDQGDRLITAIDCIVDVLSKRKCKRGEPSSSYDFD